MKSQGTLLIEVKKHFRNFYRRVEELKRNLEEANQEDIIGQFKNWNMGNENNTTSFSYLVLKYVRWTNDHSLEDEILTNSLNGNNAYFNTVELILETTFNEIKENFGDSLTVYCCNKIKVDRLHNALHGGSNEDLTPKEFITAIELQFIFMYDCFQNLFRKYYPPLRQYLVIPKNEDLKDKLIVIINVQQAEEFYRLLTERQFIHKTTDQSFFVQLLTTGDGEGYLNNYIVWIDRASHNSEINKQTIIEFVNVILDVEDDAVERQFIKQYFRTKKNDEVERNIQTRSLNRTYTDFKSSAKTDRQEEIINIAKTVFDI